MMIRALTGPLQRITLSTLIVALAGGVVTTEASAHTLSVGRAKVAISNEVGFVFEDYHRAMGTLGACSRKSELAVSCSLKVDFQVKPDTGPTGTCTGRLTAVLYRSSSGRSSVRTNYSWARNRTFACTAPGAP